MGFWLAAAAIGFASGVLSGAFGIGGGIVTTPAIRLLMGAPALVAVGTPLPVIIPTAITGAASYHRRGLADPRSALVIAAAGIPAAIAGAFIATGIGGRVVLLGTAVLTVWAASDMWLQLRPDSRASSGEEATPPAPRAITLAAIGAIAGLYSGFFGLGGGFVLVPLMTRWLRFPVKRAIGTSLVAVALLAVPGTLTHAYLGNIDWLLAAGLVLGVVPGSALGARITLVAADRAVRIGFVVLLVVAAAWLAATELFGLA